MQNVLIAAIVIEAIVILALLFIIIKSNKSNKKIMRQVAFYKPTKKNNDV